MILLGMVGTVLYNQLAGMYNDAVQATREWTKARSALQAAIDQLPDQQLTATWMEKTGDATQIASLLLAPTSVPATLLTPLRNAQEAFTRWQESQSTYDVTRQRFPVSVLAKAFKFAPVEVS